MQPLMISHLLRLCWLSNPQLAVDMGLYEVPLPFLRVLIEFSAAVHINSPVQTGKDHEYTR
jgi:hypothetical protein